LKGAAFVELVATKQSTWRDVGEHQLVFALFITDNFGFDSYVEKAGHNYGYKHGHEPKKKYERDPYGHQRGKSKLNHEYLFDLREDDHSGYSDHEHGRFHAKHDRGGYGRDAYDHGYHSHHDSDHDEYGYNHYQHGDHHHHEYSSHDSLVCGSDGKTYRNLNILSKAINKATASHGPELRLDHTGSCGVFAGVVAISGFAVHHRCVAYGTGNKICLFSF
jgi:hypothetical protein